MKLDKQQEEAVNSTDKNILVVAGAGSGKTRVLTERVEHLIDSGIEPQNIVCITFTNMASQEMKQRLGHIDCIGDAFIGTIHSFASLIYRGSGLNFQILNSEVELGIYQEILSRKVWKKKSQYTITMPRLLKLYDLQELCDRGKISEEAVQSFLLPTEHNDLKELKKEMMAICKERGIITFTELLEKAKEYYESIGGKIEHVLVDEFQDVGKDEFRFIKGLNADNTFYVGDDWQCQPSGTKVTMSDGSIKNIEDLEIGDRVVSYNQSEGRYYKDSLKGNNGKEIMDISIHNTDSLITILTKNGKESSYTKNHRCFARIHYENNNSKSVVYIMENAKGQFRVGSTRLFTDGDRNFGVRNRMNTEGGTNAWILDVYNSPNEAWLAEQICAYKFGIPQITWTYKNIKSSEEDIDILYSHLSDLREKVSLCLNLYGRDINYPIFTKNTNTHFSKIHITEIRACNLIPLVMDVAVPYVSDEYKYRHDYEQITHKFVANDINTKVYGLKVKDTETYIADGILTHNSIYGFKGGDVKIFLDLLNNPEYTVYYLENNYRNGKNIISLGEKIIRQVNSKINKEVRVMRNDIESEVIVSTKPKIGVYMDIIKKQKDYKDWFILTRTNKEILELEEMLEKKKIPYMSFKREGMTFDQMNELMQNDSVKVLTVHVSKGLENKNVILYGNFPIVCPSYRRDEDERKVMYVGVTRAEQKLIVLN
jgi:DNA helicase-2/ATP-dependent DNA helicase PcrA